MCSSSKACVVFLFLISCAKDTLQKACPYQCVDVEQETWDEERLKVLEDKMGKGVCSYGIGTCDAEHKLIKCEGTVLPSEEICDGLDNDCTGYADEWLKLWPYHENYPCLSLGECHWSYANCEDAAWKCYYPSSITELPNEISCDGYDNDCDGQPDDGVFDDWTLSQRVCYSGNPIDSLAYPPCRAGLFECIRGETICLNEQVPGPELCDTIDNDCNGFVDDTGDVLESSYDICFIVDTSGSMCDDISAVAGAANAYAAQFDGNPNFQFCLVIMSRNAPPYVYVDTNFTDFANIRTRLQSLGCNGGGAEASMDSMHNVCDAANPLALNWRPESNRLFFMLTDENQQSYVSPRTTGQMIIDACLGTSTLPFIWSLYPADFAYIANGANGAHFTLVNDWQQIFDDMNSIVIRLCQEE